MKKWVCLFLIGLLGCATPEDIAQVSEAGYVGMTLTQLTEAQNNAATDLYSAEENQRIARGNAAVLGLAGSSLSLNSAIQGRGAGASSSVYSNASLQGQIARLKGELRTIAKVAADKSWTLPPLPLRPKLVFKPAAEKTGMR